MARQTHPTDDAPKRTPSFVCEVPLRVGPSQERRLRARLEAARQVYNACLGQACTRVRLVRESKAYQHARTLPRDDPARKVLFAQARAQHGCSEYALHAYAQQFGHSWLARASGQPHEPDIGQPGLWRCQSAAPGPSPPGAGREASSSWTPSRARPTPAASAGAAIGWNGRGWCSWRSWTGVTGGGRTGSTAP